MPNLEAKKALVAEIADNRLKGTATRDVILVEHLQYPVFVVCHHRVAC